MKLQHFLSSRQHFPAYMRPIRVGNSHANIQNRIKMEQDFMPILIVCMFDEDLIKNEVAIVRITFFL